MKIFGKEVAGGCVWVEKDSGTDGGDDGGVKVQAFLVKVGIGRYNLMAD